MYVTEELAREIFNDDIEIKEVEGEKYATKFETDEINAFEAIKLGEEIKNGEVKIVKWVVPQRDLPEEVLEYKEENEGWTGRFDEMQAFIYDAEPKFIKILTEEIAKKYIAKKYYDAENVHINDEYKIRFNLKDDNVVKQNLQEDNHILKSPPPPLVDGVAIRIEGLDDVTEREAKNYIDLVVKQIAENVRKNLSSISIIKQEDGHIKLDYVVHHQKFERIRRITGYLVGSMDKWNNAKRAEEADRIKHLGNANLKNSETLSDKNKYGEFTEKITNLIIQEDFHTAYTTAINNPSFNDKDLDFMKEVIKIHGADAQKLQFAVQAITNSKGESPIFMSKLLNDALKTDEYKQAFAREQGKTQEISR